VGQYSIIFFIEKTENINPDSRRVISYVKLRDKNISDFTQIKSYSF